MSKTTLQDLAKIKAHGYTVHKFGKAWILTHSSEPNIFRGALMVGDHGALSPTKWEAVAEALARIELDSDDDFDEVPDSYLDGVDGHWYVCRYDRTLPQIHARDCATCFPPAAEFLAEHVSASAMRADVR